LSRSTGRVGGVLKASGARDAGRATKVCHQVLKIYLAHALAGMCEKRPREGLVQKRPGSMRRSPGNKRPCTLSRFCCRSVSPPRRHELDAKKNPGASALPLHMYVAAVKDRSHCAMDCTAPDPLAMLWGSLVGRCRHEYIQLRRSVFSPPQRC